MAAGGGFYNKHIPSKIVKECRGTLSPTFFDKLLTGLTIAISFLHLMTVMAIIGYEDFRRIRQEHRDKKIVFSSGSFDLPHSGHVLFLEDCRKLGDILVVGVGGDAMLKKNKGLRRPILNEHVRLKMIDSFKPVDYCFLDRTPFEEHHLTVLNTVFALLRPDFYAINNDADDIAYKRDAAARYGVALIILKRWCPPEFQDISTTQIVEKIRKIAEDT